MKKLLLTCALVTLSAGAAHAADGVDLYKLCGHNPSAFFHKADCENFIGGTVSGIAMGPHPQICFPRNFDPRQTLPIVQKFMREHPEALNNSEPEVIRLSLRDAYPCGRT
jgi:hypothetical protein